MRALAMRALILDALAARASLAGTRALAAAGWRVAVGAPDRSGLAARSRACAAWHHVPSPANGDDDFVAAVNRACQQDGYELVFAGSDLELLALSRLRDQLHAAVPYADHERVIGALDKLALVRAAGDSGLQAPRTAPATAEAIGELSDGHPVVIKERLHGTGVGAGARATEPKIVPVAEAAGWASAIRSAGREPLVQELVHGQLMAFTVVCDRASKVVACVQQRADRTWPPDVGCSVRARSEPPDPGLRAAAETLLRRLGWFGLAELQFVEPADGQPRLIDLNGRFYGSLALASAAGANLPALWAGLATGRAWNGPTEGRAGVRYQWLEGDLRGARAQQLGLSGAGGCLRYAATAHHSVWSARDPWPAAVSYGRLLASRWR